jgi:hypothetical protein
MHGRGFPTHEAGIAMVFPLGSVSDFAPELMNPEYTVPDGVVIEL